MVKGSLEILQELIRNPSQDKEDEAVAAEVLVNDYYSFQDTLFSIQALSLFVQDLDREEVLRHISNRPWIEQHEILTRWAWMTSQREEIKKKRLKRKIISFNHLYLCKVGGRVGRETLDREFYTFLLFLPGYCKDTETKYLFYEKPCDDPPDFVVIDKQGNKIGIEITEAPLEESNKQEKEGEIVRQKLEKDFPGVPITINVDDPSNWSELRKNYQEIKSRLDKGEIFCNYNFKIWIRAESRDPVIITNMPRSFSNVNDYKTSKAICKAITEKIKKGNKKLEKGITPKIKPCILVIYENTGLMIVDKRLVANLVSENLEAQWQNLYEGIWLVIQDYVFRICAKKKEL